MASPCAVELTDQTFDTEVLGSNVPVLVDFWGDGCAPCRALAPTLETLACEYTGKVKIGKLNIHDHNGPAIKYQVRSIPTLLLFKEGRVVGQRVGNAAKIELEQMLDAHI